MLKDEEHQLVKNMTSKQIGRVLAKLCKLFTKLHDENVIKIKTGKHKIMKDQLPF